MDCYQLSEDYFSFFELPLEMRLTPMFKDHKRIFGFGFKSFDRHSFGFKKNF